MARERMGQPFVVRKLSTSRSRPAGSFRPVRPGVHCGEGSRLVQGDDGHVGGFDGGAAAKQDRGARRDAAKMAEIEHQRTGRATTKSVIAR